MTRTEFIDTVLTLTTVCNISCTSWFRSKARNESVGGHENSLHLTGNACDVVPDTEGDYSAVIYWAGRLGLRVVEYDDKRCIHLQIK